MLSIYETLKIYIKHKQSLEDLFQNGRKFTLQPNLKKLAETPPNPPPPPYFISKPVIHNIQ